MTEAPHQPETEAENARLEGDASAASTPVDASAAPQTDATHASANSAEGAVDDDGADDGDDGVEGDEEEAAAGAEGAAPGDPTKKKRRRRRRKKKGPGEGLSAEGGEPRAEGEAPREGDNRGPRQGGGRNQGRDQRGPKREPHVPFVRFFEGERALEKRHAFSAGEIIAGRVERVTDQAIFIDLFGKATAVADLWEPRDPPEIPQDVSAAADTAELSDDAPATNVAAAGEAHEGEPSVAGIAVPVVESEQDVAAASAEVLAEASAAEEALDAEDESEDAAAADAGAHVDLFPEPEGTPPEAPAVGAIVRGRIGSVSESGHIAIVNTIVDRADVKARLTQAREQRRRVRGMVFGFNRGGFDVLVAGIRVFCPANGMSLTPIDDPRELIGQKLQFTIPPRKGKAKGFVVSRRTILEREGLKHRKAVLRDLAEGQELEGRVTQVREFGAFVDIGHGLEGMVHQSELDWRHGVRPGDIVKPGDVVRVRVLGVQREGKKMRNARISLSRKALLADPWDAHKDLLREGGHAKGTVVSTTDFGAFLRIADGVEGLLHITELGKELKHASQAVKVGDEMDVVIDRLDRRARRISLSRLSAVEAKALQEGGFSAANSVSLKPGAHIKVVVTKVDHGGVQIQVQGVLGKRGRGFIPFRDLGSKESSTGDMNAKPSVAVGMELDVKVVGVDRQGGLKCSVKGLETDTERAAVRDYKKESAKQGFGTFGDLLRAKLAPPDQSSEK